MDDKNFENYLKERYQDQIEWHSKKAIVNKKHYLIVQWIQIILAASTPALIAFSFAFPGHFLLKWSSVFTSVVVALLTSASTTFKIKEKWLSYRATCETLKKEYYLYTAGVGEYKDVLDKKGLFVERVESLISSDDTLREIVTRKWEPPKTE